MSISYSSLLAVEVMQVGALPGEFPFCFFDRDSGLCFMPIFDSKTGEHYAFVSGGRVFSVRPCGQGQVSLHEEGIPKVLLALRAKTYIPWKIPLSSVMFCTDMVPDQYVYTEDGVKYVCDSLVLEPITEDERQLACEEI